MDGSLASFSIPSDSLCPGTVVPSLSWKNKTQRQTRHDPRNGMAWHTVITCESKPSDSIQITPERFHFTPMDGWMGRLTHSYATDVRCQLRTALSVLYCTYCAVRAVLCCAVPPFYYCTPTPLVLFLLTWGWLERNIECLSFYECEDDS